MPTYYARSGGNINAAIWATTPTGTASDLFSTFTNADVLMTNSFSVTVNVSVTVAEMRNDNANSATSGGLFSLSNGVTVTANVFGAGSGPSPCLSLSGTASAAIVGTVTGNSHVSSNFAATVKTTSSGTLTVTGNVIGGSQQLGHAIDNNGVGTVTVTGNLSAGSGNTNYAVANTSTGTTTITGTVTGGGAGSQLAINSGAGFLVINGAVTGGTTSTSNGAANTGAGTLTINGTVTGGTSGAGAVNSSVGTLIVNGTVAGAAAVGLSQTSVGQSFVTRARGGPLTSSAAGVSNGTSGSTVTVDEIEYGDLGTSPTSGPIRFADKSSNVAVLYREGLAKATLTDVSSSLPAASNVRSGVSYASGTRTGTMAVPPAASVANGVAVGSTTGTALLNPAEFWDYATSAATVSGSIGERLANAATVASTGQQLANALTP